MDSNLFKIQNKIVFYKIRLHNVVNARLETCYSPLTMIYQIHIAQLK